MCSVPVDVDTRWDSVADAGAADYCSQQGVVVIVKSIGLDQAT